MKVQKLIHIGFGKTGTSKLQKDVFPLLCKKLNFLYVGDEYRSQELQILKIKRDLTSHVFKTMLGKKVKKINIPDNILISWEELSSYRDASLIDEFAEKNLEAFGKDAHILLTIREPRQWLSSVYLQLCMHETPIQRPEDFFLTEENYSERLPNVKFNISKFSYKKIIKSYTDRFDNVIIAKYENLYTLEFLEKIFSLNETELNDLQNNFKKGTVNKAFSKNSVSLRTKLSKLWNHFGFSHIPKYSNKIMLERSSDDYANNEIIIKKNSAYIRGVNKIYDKKKFSFFNWKNIYQKFINNFFEYEKFLLNFEKLNYIPINELENEYKEIKNLVIINKDK